MPWPRPRCKVPPALPPCAQALAAVSLSMLHAAGGLAPRASARRDPEIYRYRIVAVYPHDRRAFTQGLEFGRDCPGGRRGNCTEFFWESVGMHGESAVRQVAFPSGKVMAEHRLPDTDFGEGLTRLGSTCAGGWSGEGWWCGLGHMACCVLGAPRQPPGLFLRSLLVVWRMCGVGPGHCLACRLPSPPPPATHSTAHRTHVPSPSPWPPSHERLYQVTWKSPRAWVYQGAVLGQPRLVHTPLSDGWGATNDGTALIISNSSHVLSWVDPGDLSLLRQVPVTDGGAPVPFLNEMEWMDGRILANIWNRECLARIDPKTGRVDAWIDLQVPGVVVVGTTMMCVCVCVCVSLCVGGRKGERWCWVGWRGNGRGGASGLAHMAHRAACVGCRCWGSGATRQGHGFLTHPCSSPRMRRAGHHQTDGSAVTGRAAEPSAADGRAQWRGLGRSHRPPVCHGQAMAGAVRGGAGAGARRSRRTAGDAPGLHRHRHLCLFWVT